MARGKKKHIKRANGTGSIIKLSGTRRKPYTIRLTTDCIFNEDANKKAQKRHYLGYYETYEEAERALTEYTLNPYDINAGKITLQEIYDAWSKKAFDGASKSTVATYTNAMRYCEKIKDMPICQIKTDIMQSIVDDCQKTSSTKGTIKTLFNVLSEYAMKRDYITKNYSKYIEIEESEPIIDRIPFTIGEINILWQHSQEDSYKILIILLYTGLRVNELLKNTVDNVNLEERWIYVPKELAKNNGSIRYVPIHDKILPFLEDFVTRDKSKSNNICTKSSGVAFTYHNYMARDMVKINEVLGTQHRMHDTRHTFISQARTSELDELCIKKIVGHVAKDITSRVYTHIDQPELLIEINKLSYEEPQ